jgi:hypothetical protein
MDPDNPLERLNAARTDFAIRASMDNDRWRRAVRHATFTAILALGAALGLIVSRAFLAGLGTLATGLLLAFLMLQVKRKKITEPILNGPVPPSRILGWIRDYWHTHRVVEAGFPGHPRFSLRIDQPLYGGRTEALFLQICPDSRTVAVVKQNDGLDPRQLLEILLDEDRLPVGIVTSTLERFAITALGDKDADACQELVTTIRDAQRREQFLRG